MTPACVRPVALVLSLIAAAPGAAEPQRTRPRGYQGADGPYLKEVHGRVHVRWTAFLRELHRLDAAYQDPTLGVKMLVIINPDGSLHGVERIEGSGLRGFDEAPPDLLRSLGNLSAPPRALASDDGRTYIEWHFSRRSPGCESFAVVEHRYPLEQAIPRLISMGRPAEAAARLREEPITDPVRRHALLRLLVENLALASKDGRAPAQREAAALILGHMEGGQQHLIRMLSDPVPSVRFAALRALGQVKLSPSAVLPLKALLDSEHAAQAALLLARLGDKSALPVLAQTLGKGLLPTDCAAAMRDLGQAEEAVRLTLSLIAHPHTLPAGVQAARSLGDARVVAALTRLLSEAQEEHRPLILGALSARGPRTPQEVRRIIYRHINDPAPNMRIHAIFASAAIGDRSVGLRYRLFDALADPDAGVRAAAASALAEIAGEDARDELLRAALRESSRPARVSIYRALLAHPFPSAAIIRARLRGRDPEVEGLASAPETRGVGPDGAAQAEGRPPGVAIERALVLIGGDEGTLAERLLSTSDETERLGIAASWISGLSETGSGSSRAP